MKVAIITANTDIYKEREENTSGEMIRDLVTEAGLEIVFLRALPKDRKVLSTVMQRMADNHLTDLILVTGGSGCGPSDCTPEATRDVIDREVPGITLSGVSSGCEDSPQKLLEMAEHHGFHPPSREEHPFDPEGVPRPGL